MNVGGEFQVDIRFMLIGDNDSWKYLVIMLIGDDAN